MEERGLSRRFRNTFIVEYDFILETTLIKEQHRDTNYTWSNGGRTLYVVDLMRLGFDENYEIVYEGPADVRVKFNYRGHPVHFICYSKV